MKAVLAIVSLVATLGSTASLWERDDRNKLPTIDLQTLSADLYRSSSADAVVFGRKLSARDCPAGYPFICDGRCCVYNICCPRQCCRPDTDFCGADGLCYRYN
ncbi:hypothetical protein F5883DRAFT_251527 [Diaporthe sp. PMI_573]|jgi:hypothetical protein|nr:hypothetical protein F5883DRAFT_251527 [Diaporthaceae sp. PMI_573]